MLKRQNAELKQDVVAAVNSAEQVKTDLSETKTALLTSLDSVNVFVEEPVRLAAVMAPHQKKK
jgi:hypothetical protein